MLTHANKTLNEKVQRTGKACIALEDNRPHAIQRKRNSECAHPVQPLQNNSEETKTGSGVSDASLSTPDKGTVQRYTDLSKGHIFGYGKGKGAAAPQFEFQKSEARRTENPATSKATYDVHTSQHFEDAPKLKVSDNYDMAVPTAQGAEAKHFFATPGIIAASNLALNTAGAPLTLVGGAGRITLPSLWNPFGIALTQVSPALPVGLLQDTECGVFAQNILGIDVHRIELIIAGQPVVTQLTRLTRDTTLNAALGGHAPESIGGNSHADPDVGDAFGIFARNVVPPVGLITKLWTDITTMRGLLNEARTHIQWREHWAGVVAKSGSDYVTLENYNRSSAGTDLILAQLEKDYREVVANGDVHAFVGATRKYRTVQNESRLQRLARLGRNYVKYGVKIGGFTGFYQNQLLNMWYFAMYGTAKQSFHDTWKKSVPNAVTAKVPQ